MTKLLQCLRDELVRRDYDQIRAFSRHRALTTMLVYRDAREHMAVQRQLADVVAATLTT